VELNTYIVLTIQIISSERLIYIVWNKDGVGRRGGYRSVVPKMWPAQQQWLIGVLKVYWRLVKNSENKVELERYQKSKAYNKTSHLWCVSECSNNLSLLCIFCVYVAGKGMQGRRDL
jgi:hypothetical protein